MIIVAIVIVLVLLFVIYYIYKVYRKKLQKQKAVARGFIENKEGWAAELNHLDESDRYFMDRFKKKILENMGNADMKMDDLGSPDAVEQGTALSQGEGYDRKNACRAPERDAPAESLYPLAANRQDNLKFRQK